MTFLFPAGNQVKNIKNRIDEIDEETLTYNYTLIEGEALKDKFASIAHEIKFEAAPDGGSVSKVTNKYYLKGDVQINEEDTLRLARRRSLNTLFQTHLIN